MHRVGQLVVVRCGRATTTAIQIGGALGVAAFGTLYLSLTSRTGAAHATHAFALTTAAFAVVALLATATAHPATRPPTVSRTQRPNAPGPALIAAAGDQTVTGSALIANCSS